MIYKDQRAVNTALKAGAFLSPILLYGSEEYQKEQYKKMLLPDESDGFDFQSMDFGDFQLGAFYQAVTTPPFLSGERVVLVYDFSPKGCNAELLKKLGEALEERYPDCRVLFIEKSGSFDEKRDEKSKKIIKLFDKLGSVLPCPQVSEQEAQRMLIERAGEEGGSIEKGAARLLVEYHGLGLWGLFSELDKLLSYKSGGSIQEADVETLVCRHPEENIYGLSKAILRGAYKEAVNILDGLFDLRYPPESILGTLSGVYIDMVRAKVAGGRPISTVASDFGYGKRSFALEQAARQRRISSEYLLYALDVLQKADLRLKSTQNDERTVLEWAVSALFLKDRVPTV